MVASARQAATIFRNIRRIVISIMPLLTIRIQIMRVVEIHIEIVLLARIVAMTFMVNTSYASEKYKSTPWGSQVQFSKSKSSSSNPQVLKDSQLDLGVEV